eukprot:352927-Chlamydomonas_euryale.AAC.5
MVVKDVGEACQHKAVRDRQALGSCGTCCCESLLQAEHFAPDWATDRVRASSRDHAARTTDASWLVGRKAKRLWSGRLLSVRPVHEMGWGREAGSVHSWR